MKFIILFILSFVLSTAAFAGEHPKAPMKTVMISGKVLDSKNNESLTGVKIECTGCQKVIYSDLDGNFFIYVQVEAKQDITLEVTQVGYVTKTLSLKEAGASASNLELSLVSE